MCTENSLSKSMSSNASLINITKGKVLVKLFDRISWKSISHSSFLAFHQRLNFYTIFRSYAVL